MASTHKETKQFYTLYNTLDDTKLYLNKEVSDIGQQFYTLYNTLDDTKLYLNKEVSHIEQAV